MENSISSSPDATWRFRDVVLISFGALAIFILGIGALRLLTDLLQTSLTTGGEPTIYLTAGMGALEGLALIGSVFLLGLMRRQISWSEVGLKPISDSWLLRSLLLGFVAIPLAGLIAALVQSLLGQPLINSQNEFLAPAGFSWFGLVSMLLLGGLVAPFAEELFFRGVIYAWLREHWGVIPSVLVSGLIFGMVHVEPSVAAAAFVLGVLLAWVYESSNSLWSAVIIHAINNSVKIILLYAVLASGNVPV
jgi:membrane protease YdiL (CAAX protease family)